MIIHQNSEALNQTDQAGTPETYFYEGLQFPLFEVQNRQDREVDQRGDARSRLASLKQIDPYVTSYVCLLVPRFEEHLLIGDLSDQLHSWMKDICISFGWKLKFIDINPKYLHWVMIVGITEFPAQFMRIVRHESSKRIFEDFPKFSQKNRSNEFWAPWYFVGVGEAPYSQNSIQSFIKQIRMEQGLR